MYGLLTNNVFLTDGFWSIFLKQIVAVVKPFLAEKVLTKLSELSFDYLEVVVVKGYSRQKSYLDRYAGSEYSTAFLPKVQITFWAQEEMGELLLRTLVITARTGRIGDGKILVSPVSKSFDYAKEDEHP